MIRLKELRAKKNMSLRDLASVLNISYSSLGKYERGEQQPSYETLIKIANYFNVTTDYLVGITNAKLPDFRKISDDLNLSDDSIAKLKKLPLVIDRNNGMSLADILNEIIIHPKFEKLLKSMLLYVSRDQNEWYKLQNYLNKNSNSPLTLDSIKDLDIMCISQIFNTILIDTLNNDISTYNKIQQTENGLIISKKCSENNNF